MLEDFQKTLSENSQELIEHGYFITDAEDQGDLDNIKQSFIGYLKEFHKIGLINNDLESLHEQVSVKDINDIRFGFYNYMNNADEDFALRYLNLGKDSIIEVAGSELASNKNVNFSIQMPNDESSVLPLHSDIFSGESPYQINLWVPLTNASDTNSMFLFNPEFSQFICKNFSKYEEKGLDALMDNNKDNFSFLTVPYGKILIFSPTCLHGNIINKTNVTRISFNCRYKNLFTPYNQAQESEKKLATFYKPITPKAASFIGLNFEIDEE
tara:strand:- start:667 stop:1473 length:807 start_codon:yes stop_codon:yes gene_type:complete